MRIQFHFFILLHIAWVSAKKTRRHFIEFIIYRVKLLCPLLSLHIFLNLFWSSVLLLSAPAMLRRNASCVSKHLRGTLSASPFCLFLRHDSPFCVLPVEQKIFVSSLSGNEHSKKIQPKHLSDPPRSSPARSLPQPLAAMEEVGEPSSEVDESVMEELLQEMDEPQLADDELELTASQDEEELAASRDTNDVIGEEMFEPEEVTKSPGATLTPSGGTERTNPSSTPPTVLQSEGKLCETEGSETMIQAKLNSPDLQVPELSYRPRLFLYGSVYNSAHPREAGRHKRNSRKRASSDAQTPGKSKVLVSPQRFQELSHWCHTILPAVPTDDFSDIQNANATALPLVTNLYLAEDPRCLWKAYEKKFMKHAKTRTEAEMESFQSNFAQYDLSSVTDFFCELKNARTGIIHLIKKLREDLDLFAKHHAAIEKGRERINTLPPSFLPLNSYPLTILVSSSLSDAKEAEQLQEQLRSAISRSRIIPNNLIYNVASDLHVCVLDQEETTKMRDALMEGDIGCAWPDHSAFMKVVKKEDNNLEVGLVQHRRAYVEWRAPEPRSFHQDPEVVVSEKDIAKALKMIRKRKEVAVTTSKPPPPADLFPLKAKLFPNIRTARLSDQVGLVLPSTAHLFVVDTRDHWKGNSEDVAPLVGQALKWQSVDGSPLLFTTTQYELECPANCNNDNTVEPPAKSESTVPSFVSVNDEPESFRPPKDAVLTKLWSLLQTGRKPIIASSFNGHGDEREVDSSTFSLQASFGTSHESSNVTSESLSSVGKGATTIAKGWKNDSLVPLVFVFQTSFTIEKASEVQRLLNRNILRANGKAPNSICVLSKEFSGDEEIERLASPSFHVDSTVNCTCATPWAVHSLRDRPFPLKILQKEASGDGSIIVSLIQERTLVEPSLVQDNNSKRDHSSNEESIDSSICGGPQCFFTPYLLSLQSKPSPMKPFLENGMENNENYNCEENSLHEKHEVHEG